MLIFDAVGFRNPTERRSLTNAATATVDIASTAWQDYIVPIDPEAAKGTRNVFFVFTESTNVQFDAWQFGKEDLTACSVGFANPTALNMSICNAAKSRSTSNRAKSLVSHYKCSYSMRLDSEIQPSGLMIVTC